MRPRTRTAIGIIPELMHMHAALGIGVVAADIPRDGRVRGLGALLKVHRAGDGGVAAEDGYY